MAGTEVRHRQWTCFYCGYVYDEEQGCPDVGIAPGTSWDAVPEDFCCPMCSGDKSDFVAVED